MRPLPLNRCILENGLRVVHLCDDTTRMVTLNILYGVGARDESPHRTGLAHLLEHLMFEGSAHIPSYDRPVQQAGGENNAYTNNDFTNYYITLPAQNVETAFWLESDRMTGLQPTAEKLAVQRQVVMEEFKQGDLNQPYGDVNKLLRAMAFKRHPYRWCTIGKELSHIAGATLPVVEEFYHRFYCPANAVLAIVGNLSWEEAQKLARKWFGPLPGGEPAFHNLPAEPRQRVQRRMTVERQVPANALYMAFHMSSRQEPDYYTFDLISDLLANGYSGRLMQHLVKKQHLFDSIDAYISDSVDGGLLRINGRLAPHTSWHTAEEAVWNELAQLATGPLTRREMDKVKNRFESEQIFSRINGQSLAASLALHEWMGDARNIEQEVEKYRNVTTDDVRRVAAHALVPAHSCVLVYKKKEE